MKSWERGSEGSRQTLVEVVDAVDFAEVLAQWRVVAYPVVLALAAMLVFVSVFVERMAIFHPLVLVIVATARPAHCATSASARRFAFSARYFAAVAAPPFAAFDYFRRILAGVGVRTVAAFKAVIHAIQSRECEERRRRLEVKRNAGTVPAWFRGAQTPV